MGTLNVAQRVVLVLGAGGMVGVLLFPSWLTPYGRDSWVLGLGRHTAWNPPPAFTEREPTTDAERTTDDFLKKWGSPEPPPAAPAPPEQPPPMIRYGRPDTGHAALELAGVAAITAALYLALGIAGRRVG